MHFSPHLLPQLLHFNLNNTSKTPFIFFSFHLLPLLPSSSFLFPFPSCYANPYQLKAPAHTIAFKMTWIPSVLPSAQPFSNLPLFNIYPDTLCLCVIHKSTALWNAMWKHEKLFFINCHTYFTVLGHRRLESSSMFKIKLTIICSQYIFIILLLCVWFRRDTVSILRKSIESWTDSENWEW